MAIVDVEVVLDTRRKSKMTLDGFVDTAMTAESDGHYFSGWMYKRGNKLPHLRGISSDATSSSRMRAKRQSYVLFRFCGG